MKKFIGLFFAAFVAVATISLTSCSSDNEDKSEPSSSGSYYCSLTIDGKQLNGATVSGEIDKTGSVSYLTVWVNTNYVSDSWLTFSFCADTSIGCTVSKGLVLTNETAWNDGIGTYFYGDVCAGDGDSFSFSHIVSGTLTVLDYSESSQFIELEFNNCELKYMSKSKTVVVNGKLKAPLRGSDVEVNI